MNESERIALLTAIYAEAVENLTKIIKDKSTRGNATQYKKNILAQVYKELSQLNVEAENWANEHVPELYSAGINDTNKAFTLLGVSIPIVASFSKLHTEAIRGIVENTVDDLKASHAHIGRQYLDTLRQVGLEATAKKISQGETVKYMKKQMLNKLAEKQINAIVYKNGRVVPVEVYSALVARSTSREAYNRATMNQVTESGHDLVKISGHSTTCALCAALQGRIYSISGKDTRYPPLNRAFTGIYANIHVNCRCALAPYIPVLADTPEKDLEFSNRPFDIDPRTEVERKRYDDKQKILRDRNNDRRQYEKYKTADTDGTPKTFSGFRKMVKHNSESYKKLKANYDNLNK